MFFSIVPVDKYEIHPHAVNNLSKFPYYYSSWSKDKNNCVYLYTWIARKVQVLWDNMVLRTPKVLIIKNGRPDSSNRKPTSIIQQSSVSKVNISWQTNHQPAVVPWIKLGELPETNSNKIRQCLDHGALKWIGNMLRFDSWGNGTMELWEPIVLQRKVKLLTRLISGTWSILQQWHRNTTHEYIYIFRYTHIFVL